MFFSYLRHRIAEVIVFLYIGFYSLFRPMRLSSQVIILGQDTSFRRAIDYTLIVTAVFFFLELVIYMAFGIEHNKGNEERLGETLLPFIIVIPSFFFFLFMRLVKASQTPLSHYFHCYCYFYYAYMIVLILITQLPIAILLMSAQLYGDSWLAGTPAPQLAASIPACTAKVASEACIQNVRDNLFTEHVSQIPGFWAARASAFGAMAILAAAVVTHIIVVKQKLQVGYLVSILFYTAFIGGIGILAQFADQSVPAASDPRPTTEEASKPPPTSQSVPDLTKVIERDPKSADTYFERGNAYDASRDNERAIADYTKALELEPNFDEAYSMRGGVYLRIGALDNAVSDYTKAIELDTQDPNYYYGRGRAYFRKRDYIRAIQDFSKAIDLDPKYVQAYSLRASAYDRQRERQRMIADYEKVVLLITAPKTADEYNSRAWAHFKLGKAEQALPDAEKSLELRPNNAYALDTRGHVFEALKRREEAIADFRRALSIEPDLLSSKTALRRLDVSQ
jgi:tetratricopeptide (TPR) repeat protein